MPEKPFDRNTFLDRAWEIARNQIRDEDNLINHRMSWLMTSNLFLFSAFFVIFSGSTSTQLGNSKLAETFLLLIPLAGIAVCWTVWHLVRCATDQVNLVNQWWIGQRSKYPENQNDYPPLVGKTRYNFKDWKNIYSILPFIMLIAWILLFLVSVASLFQKFQQEILYYGIVSLVLITIFCYVVFLLKTEFN